MAETKKPVATLKAETKAAEVKAEVKTAETKAVAKKEEVKATAKKAAAKTTATAKKAATKTATTAKSVAKKAETAVASKKAAATVHVQFDGKSYTTEDLVKIAKDVWKYDLNGKDADFKNVEIYVKPEESTAYFVINGVAGSFNI